MEKHTEISQLGEFGLIERIRELVNFHVDDRERRTGSVAFWRMGSLSKMIVDCRIYFPLQVNS